MKSRRNAARKLLELLLQTSLFFMTEKKLSVPLKVVVMLLCRRGLLRPFLQQNWHMQLLRVCKQTTNEKQPTRFRANFTMCLVCKVRTF